MRCSWMVFWGWSSGDGSMEVAAAQRQRFGFGTRAPRKFRREKVAVAQPRQLRGKIDKAFRDHMDDKARALQPAAHGQKPRRHHRAAVSFKDLGPDNDIG